MSDAAAILHALWGLDGESPAARALPMLARTARRAVDADESSILVLDHKASELVFARTAAAGSEDALAGTRVPIDRGLVGLAVATGEAQVGAPLYRSPDGSGPADVLDAPAWVIAAPMTIGDAPVGVLTAVRHDARRPFVARDIDVMSGLAALGAAIVLLTARPDETPSAMPSSNEAMRQRLATRFAAILARGGDRLERIEPLLDAIETLLR